MQHAYRVYPLNVGRRKLGDSGILGDNLLICVAEALCGKFMRRYKFSKTTERFGVISEKINKVSTFLGEDHVTGD